MFDDLASSLIGAAFQTMRATDSRGLGGSRANGHHDDKAASAVPSVSGKPASSQRAYQDVDGLDHHDRRLQRLKTP
ncbi:MAG: hypothetical protein A2V62_04835 [Nitrospirae bacterium RBG_19FT_COMBO_58_9]|nr:MAG: hypothetical protein A2V62_04835 [Nitrospirae bacterium RBG_19FT_COMBO_58_9]